ncbi:MAG: beta-N-acetylhexosaminidase, partial [Zetaproteobacteria bacterium]
AGLHHVMTAHVIYDQVDEAVATCSPFWLRDVLRGRMGFSGHVWSDDLCMRGVGADPVDAAASALAAGCDVLLVCQPAGVRQVYEQLRA